MKRYIFMVLFIFLAFDCYADGLDSLIDIAKAQGEMQKVYAEETKAYQKVASAMVSGAVEKGQTKDEIQNRYGEPVVAIHDEERDRDKWIYKPASSSFFKGPKIYLFFNNESKLDEIKKVE